MGPVATADDVYGGCSSERVRGESAIGGESAGGMCTDRGKGRSGLPLCLLDICLLRASLRVLLPLLPWPSPLCCRPDSCRCSDFVCVWKSCSMLAAPPACPPAVAAAVAAPPPSALDSCRLSACALFASCESTSSIAVASGNCGGFRLVSLGRGFLLRSWPEDTSCCARCWNSSSSCCSCCGMLPLCELSLLVPDVADALETEASLPPDAAACWCRCRRTALLLLLRPCAHPLRWGLCWRDSSSESNSESNAFCRLLTSATRGCIMSSTHAAPSADSMLPG